MTVTAIQQQGSSGTVHPYIESRAGVNGGEPAVAGTRITVRLIAGWHRMGQSVDEIVAMYPHLNHAQVHDALSYYYDHKAEIETLLAEHNEDKVMRDHGGADWQP